MPSLSDKLRALGVKVGAGDLPSLSTREGILLDKLPGKDISRNPYMVETILNGHYRSTPQGEVFTVEEHYPEGQAHGRAALAITASLSVLAEWVGDPRLSDIPSQAIAFLDTETTGLSGGTGTYAFLIGVGRFETGEATTDGEFHLAQFFLRDPIEEPAQLIALEEFLAPCQALVTFNGKAFDIPLLHTRFTTHGWKAPFSELAHVDLLHLSRRLWRQRLPSRTLSNLEVQIMGALRSEEDIPGWMIPAIYFDYLRDGDARPLRRVFYHNAMDVISLAALLDHVANLLNDPLRLGSRYSVDLIALARLFEDLGDIDTAADLYLHGLEHEDVETERLPRSMLIQAFHRLALIHKRRANWPVAIQLWKQAARYQHLQAHLELAKCYEHSLGDINEAIFWSQSAVDIIENLPEMENITIAKDELTLRNNLHWSIERVESREAKVELHLTPYEKRQWLEDFQHRLERLHRKLPHS